MKGFALVYHGSDLKNLLYLKYCVHLDLARHWFKPTNVRLLRWTLKSLSTHVHCVNCMLENINIDRPDAF